MNNYRLLKRNRREHIWSGDAKNIITYMASNKYDNSMMSFVIFDAVVYGWIFGMNEDFVAKRQLKCLKWKF